MLEVIVAVSLTIFILTAVYSTLYYAGKSTAQTRAQTLKKQEIMKVFFQMRRQLVNLYGNKEQASLLGIEGLSPKESEIYFITTGPMNSAGVGEVGYKIKREYEETPSLYYTEFPYPRLKDPFAYNNVRDKWHPVSTIIKGFQAEYESQNEWFREWKKKELPDSIRITLWYEEEPGGNLASYTFTVVPGLKSSF